MLFSTLNLSIIRGTLEEKGLKMADADVPDWLRNDTNRAKDNLEPLRQMEGGEVAENQIATEGKNKIVFWTLKVVTMGLCLLMAFTSLVGLSSIKDFSATGEIFVAVYMLFFSGLLFLFETVQIKSLEILDNLFRRNFGFLYNTMGKSLFIIFIAFLSFGLGEPLTLSFICGFLTASFGVAELALYLKFPEFFE